MNKNSVELIGHYGSDEVIACSAWTSTSREITEEKRARIPSLIEMLWSNGHETPFEKGSVHFLVNCDIASHIHLLKHRISSINAESARYKELKENKTYIPNDWTGARVLSLLGADPSMTWDRLLKIYTDLGNAYYHACIKDLEPLLGRKRAKESARFFKTYNSQIQADVSFNMRSFANFLKLRKSEHAQLEIREIASKMLVCVKNIANNPFQYTINSWEKIGVV
jgi:thymidylate synthase (FAD)